MVKLNKKLLLLLSLILFILFIFVFKNFFNYHENAIGKKTGAKPATNTKACKITPFDAYSQMQNNKSNCQEIVDTTYKGYDVKYDYCLIDVNSGNTNKGKNKGSGSGSGSSSGATGPICSKSIIDGAKKQGNVKTLPNTTTGICKTTFNKTFQYSDSNCIKNGTILDSVPDKDKYDNKSALGDNIYIKKL